MLCATLTISRKQGPNGQKVSANNTSAPRRSQECWSEWSAIAAAAARTIALREERWSEWHRRARRGRVLGAPMRAPQWLGSHSRRCPEPCPERSKILTCANRTRRPELPVVAEVVLQVGSC